MKPWCGIDFGTTENSDTGSSGPGVNKNEFPAASFQRCGGEEAIIDFEIPTLSIVPRAAHRF